jgi:hypothetical protein
MHRYFLHLTNKLVSEAAITRLAASSSNPHFDSAQKSNRLPSKPVFAVVEQHIGR